MNFIRYFSTGNNKDEIKKIVYEWTPLIQEWLINAISDKTRHIEVSKLLSGPVEELVNKYIREQTNKKVEAVQGKAYDSVIFCREEENCDFDETETKTMKKIRVQTKLRKGNGWTLKTTRYNDKNYKINEFDLLVVYQPGENFNLAAGKIHAIPAKELRDKKKPGHMVSNVPALLKKKYMNLETIEVIKNSFFEK
jgi:hypothetical protein